MASHAGELFGGDEPIEAGRVHITVWNHCRSTHVPIVPMNTLRTWKDFFHQFGLGADSNFNIALADLGNPHLLCSEGTLPVYSSSLGTLQFHVAVHCFSSRSLHDDMSGVTSDVCADEMMRRKVSANELVHFRNTNGVGNLSGSSLSA